MLASRSHAMRLLARPVGRSFSSRALPQFADQASAPAHFQSGDMTVTQEISVLGLPLAAVDVLVRMGPKTFETLGEKPRAKTVDRAAFLELMENEISMRGHDCDMTDLDALLRMQASDDQLSRETLDELLTGLQGSVSNL